MNDRLGELLAANDVLYCMLCRDATAIDIELYAQEGYHIVWLDLEHSAQSTDEVLRLGRTVSHLGMVPLVRVLELSRTHLQRLLDGGIPIVNLPDIRSADEARELVRLGKYPPMGGRGASSTSAGTGYRLGADPQETLRQTNLATHMMTMIESDEGYGNLDEILAVDGIDILTVGPSDWSIGLGLFGQAASDHLAPKIDHVFRAAHAAGKTTVMGVGSAEQVRHYYDLGVRVFSIGADVSVKRRAYAEAIAPLKAAFGSG